MPLTPRDAAQGRVELKVTSPGCPVSGVCYLPQERRVTVPLPAPR